MSSSGVFQAAAFIEQVWREVDHVCGLVEGGLAQSDLEVTFRGVEEHGDDYSQRRMSYEYKLRRVYKNQKRTAQLVLYFELSRDGQPTAWPYSHSPVLIVAYDYDYDNGWTVEMLARGTDGQIEDPETRKNVRSLKTFANQIFVWAADETGSFQWPRLSWGFGVELTSLTDPEQVERHIIQPLLDLLKENKEPATAFQDAQLVTWPS